jgi:hypothetical protein
MSKFMQLEKPQRVVVWDLDVYSFQLQFVIKISNVLMVFRWPNMAVWLVYLFFVFLKDRDLSN